MADNSERLWDTLKAVSYVIGSHGMYDGEHMARVANLAGILGEELGLTVPDIDSLRYAVLLHDIGQIRVKETILRKPGHLTREEFLKVQAHAMESEHIIGMMPGLERAAQWVRWHHEWWDGSGYPDRIQGDRIPLPSRIIVVVDAYSAMISERPYRGAMTQDEALQELTLMAGIQFDPLVVKAFLGLVNEGKITEAILK